jgi:hypothetical protein
MDPAGHQVDDTGTAGVIARPPLVFLTALLLGVVSDRLLHLPFPVPGIDLVHWMIAGSLILIGWIRCGNPVFRYFGGSVCTRTIRAIYGR